MFDQFNQIIISAVLIFYAIFVSFITKKTFDFMLKKKINKNDAIYYNRKLVHILAGGSFCLMWGFTVFILWHLIGVPWIAIIPIAYMAFGDGITGIVRNAMFKRRTKHPLGNLYMFGICAPIGFIFAQISNVDGLIFWAVIAAAVASIVERYEFGFIDDNILITIASSITIYIGFILNNLFL